MKKLFSIIISIFITLSSINLSQAEFNILDPVWNVDGWIYLEVINDHNNSFVIVDKDLREVPLVENSFTVPGVWKFENPLIYTIYDSTLFLNSEYQLLVIKSSLKHGGI